MRFFQIIIIIIIIHFRYKEMLSDLVDDDLLSDSVSLPTSTKTMVHMSNSSKFEDICM